MSTSRSVRREIVAGFVSLLLLLSLVGSYALFRQQRTVTALRLQNQSYLSLALSLTKADAAQTVMNTLLERFIDRPDPAWRAWMVGDRRTRRAMIRRARDDAAGGRSHARAGDDIRLLESFERTLGRVDGAYREDERTFDALFDALAARDRGLAAQLHRALVVREGAAGEDLSRLLREIEGRMHGLAREASDEQDLALRVLSIATAVALAVGIFWLLSIQRALRPLALLIARVRAVAGGDLSARRVRARNDEIGELAREFENMVEAVRGRNQSLAEKAEAIRRAEQHLEQVVATLRAAVMVVGPDGTVHSANPAARRLADGSVLTGVTFGRTPFGSMEDVANAVEQTRAGKTSAITLLAVPMGSRALDVAVATFVTPAGSGDGALVVADDVTEREIARARMLQNERLAAVGRMAAHVTHEVRNPLSSMALNAEMLADEARALGAKGREIERLIGAIQREIDRLTGITEEYLRVARLPRPRLEREDVSALVEEAVGFVSVELTRAGIHVRLEVGTGAFTAMLDEQQIRQALLNLLRNARDALEGIASDARAILVSVRAAEGGVEVSVADSGPGIPPEVRAHLFDLFFTTKEKGSGLGLPLTREIVLAHGGTIDATVASAAEGGGAKFVIWLPA